MKKIVLLATSVSFLCAGPMVKPLVDYDKADVAEAETKVEKVKLTLPPAEPPVVTTPGIRKKSFLYELDLLAGRNWADDDSVLKDATPVGIHLSRYITDDVAIQIGYDRIFDADYKFSSNTRSVRNTDQATAADCPDGYYCVCVPCPDNSTDTDNQDNVDNPNDNVDTGDQNYDNGGDTDTGNNLPADDGSINDNGDYTDNNDDNTGSDTGNDNNSGEDNTTPDNTDTTTPPVSNTSLYGTTRSTDVDRFYINALKEVHRDNTRIIPFFFAGLGYEHVNDKNLGIDSQGFFNAGGGLKYKLDDKFRLVSEAKAIRKFKDSDIDIVAMLGVGMLFGQHEQKPLSPQAPVSTNLEPKPQQQDLSLVLLDAQPQPKPETKPAAITEIRPVVTAPAVPTPSVKTIIAEQNTPPVPETAPAPVIEDDAYYIQIAIVTTEQSMQEYLDRLRKSGLPYTTKSVKIKNKEGHRILAGPYISRTEAAEDLKRVKKIERDAFIRQI